MTAHPDWPSWDTPGDAAGRKAVDVVREHLAIVSAREVGPLLASGAVLGEGRPIGINDTLRAGEVLRVDPSAIERLRRSRAVTEPADLDVPVRHEDDDVVVVDKPPGLHVHPMGPYRRDTLVGAMLWRAGARPDQPWAAWRPYPAHRLDRPASGLLVFAKRRDVRDRLQRLIEGGEVERTYHAVVVGDVAGDAGTIEVPLGTDPAARYRRAPVAEADGGRPAVTHWRVLHRIDGRTLLEVRLGTGRTHQIRAHLASSGHPIVGDALYLGTGRTAAAIALRAVRLALPHPRTAAPLQLEVSGLTAAWRP